MVGECAFGLNLNPHSSEISSLAALTVREKDYANLFGLLEREGQRQLDSLDRCSSCGEVLGKMDKQYWIQAI